jgi:hypothetical protein
MTKAQVKTKKRVSDHGEVFTHEREVNAVLDILKDETLRIDSRFLEPACGDGNFLSEILNRKLNVVKTKYKKSAFEFERYSIIALSSLYGVDILEDNVLQCRQNLYKIFEAAFKASFPKEGTSPSVESAKYILERNILWGDALTMRMVDGSDAPIIFSEWVAVNGKQIKRRDYTLANLLAYQPMGEGSLFSDLGEEAFIPHPVKDFPLTHFRMLSQHV